VAPYIGRNSSSVGPEELPLDEEQVHIRKHDAEALPFDVAPERDEQRRQDVQVRRGRAGVTNTSPSMTS